MKPKNVIRILCLSFFPLLFLWAEPVALFNPPRTWQSAQPKKPSDFVQIAFVSKESFSFRPSINIAMEEIDVSLKEYVKAVKEIHSRESGTKWRDLGKFSMKGGVGRLTEMTSQTPFGETKILQAILVREKRAYLLTASALKKDFPSLQKEILSSLQSLALYENLFAAIPDLAKQMRLADFFASLGSRDPGENRVIAKQKQLKRLLTEILEGYPEMGGHWEFLALKEGISKIEEAFR